MPVEIEHSQNTEPPGVSTPTPAPTVGPSEKPSIQSIQQTPTKSQQDVPKNYMTRATFQSVLSEALKTLPRREDVKNISDEEAHGIPLVVREKSRPLGQIADIIHDNPELIPDAIAFYELCARTDEMLNSIRGRCLSNYKKFSKQLKLPMNLTGYPPDVVKLSNFIP